MFDEIMDKIIEESGFTKEMLRRGRLIGQQKVKNEARRWVILEEVGERFPTLLQEARTHLETLVDVAQLQKITLAVMRADDEAAARTALGLPQP